MSHFYSCNFRLSDQNKRITKPGKSMQGIWQKIIKIFEINKKKRATLTRLLNFFF